MLRARHVVADEQLWTGVELDVDAPLAVLRGSCVTTARCGSPAGMSAK